MSALTPGTVSLAALEAVYRGGAARLDPAARPAVEASARAVALAASGDAPIYGVNTGFGKLASVKIAAADTSALQRNLILSHRHVPPFHNSNICGLKNWVRIKTQVIQVFVLTCIAFKVFP